MYELAAGGGPFEALAVALLTVALGGAVGWRLRKLIVPEGKATTPSQLGRSWAGWVVFLVSMGLLSRFFGKWDAISLVMWFIGTAVWAFVAFALGWGYGALFKFRVTGLTTGAASPASSRPSGIDEEAIYGAIGHELEAGVADKALWTRLFAEAEGDENKVKALYIKQRFDRLVAQERERLTRVQESTKTDPYAAH